MQKVRKRDGTLVDFQKLKIQSAIDKAFKSCDYPIPNHVSKEIATEIANMPDYCLGVEDIQDLVEEKLMKGDFSNVAKAYILYREKRTQERSRKSEMMKTFEEKIFARKKRKQNANIDEESFGGREGEASSAIKKDYALNYCMSEKSRNNHLNNEIYIHDLDAYVLGSHNCLSIPFDDLLKNGFITRQTDVRPANSINTAFQLVAVIFQLQSLQQFGGCSATHLDWTMIPYVRKSFYKHYKKGLIYCQNLATELAETMYQKCLENEFKITDSYFTNNSQKAYDYALQMTKEELRQAAEGLLHNLNTLQSRSGNQLPFTSINFGTCTEEEGRLVSKALLEATILGLGSVHRTSIFPCSIFQYKKGINDKPGTPNYDLFQLALKSTAQRLYPNYANCDWSGNAGYDPNDPRTFFSTMGCRTTNGWDINGLGQQKDGRGNICPVTIIMPTLAMKAKETFALHNHTSNTIDINVVEIFMYILEYKIQEAKDMLLERFEWICSQSPNSAKFMYQNGIMAGYVPEQGIRSALVHGTLAIGQLGLAETLQILIGKDHTAEEGMELAKRIEQLFKDCCAQFKEEYKLNFGVYMTPAENLCYTAMKKFKKQYGEIPNVSDKDYFTNSMHIPVWKEMSPFDKIDLESQLTGYSSAGCITYVELDGSIKHNLNALESIVTYAMEKDIPYFAVNVPNDTCLDCGFTDEFNDSCPECHSANIQQLRRVTGYLTGNYTTAFNEGKIAEVNDRVKHR